MNDISLVFLDVEKAKQALKDLERDTNIVWQGGLEKPTEYMDWEDEVKEGFIELRINQPNINLPRPHLSYGNHSEDLIEFLKDNEGFMFLIK